MPIKGLLLLRAAASANKYCTTASAMLLTPVLDYLFQIDVDEVGWGGRGLQICKIQTKLRDTNYQ